MTATKAGTGILVEWADSSAAPGFVSYELQRKTLGGAWGAISSPVTPYYFDKDVPNGGYLYQVRTIADEVSVWTVLSDYIFIGETRFGWTFGNYLVPDGSFGVALTPDDIRYSFLWGIDLLASNGESYTDNQIAYSVKSALVEIERALNLDIYKKKRVCEPVNSNYDEEEDPYPFRPDLWRGKGFVQLRHFPLISVERAELYNEVGLRILDLMNWIRIDKKKAILHFYPKTDGSGVYVGSFFGALASPNYNSGIYYPHGLKIDYTSGFQDASRIPEDMRDIIGKVTALKLLNVVGDGLIAGFSSSSLSLDGVSESFSSTQSATSAYFGARIKVYADDVSKWLKDNRRKFGAFPMGMI